MTMRQGDERRAGPTATGAHAKLTDQHAHLLRQVSDRAERLYAVTAQNRWPERELAALADYLRAEVIRQVRDEERLLFPSYDVTPGLSRLTRDHVRLRAGIDAIEGAARGEHCSPAQIATITRDLLTQLESHFRTASEEFGGHEAPATSSLGAHPHHWYPLTEGPVIDLDLLPADQAFDAVSARLRRLGHRERLDLCSGTDPDQLCRRLSAAERDYGFAYEEMGPNRWRVQVTRRA